MRAFMLRIHPVVLIFPIAMMVLGMGMVSGQGYPNKPIRIVTGGGGGSSDVVTRLIAQGISDPLGQPVIVDNRGGLIIQGEILSRASPDGYTLLISGNSLGIQPLLVKASYDPLKDFSPVMLISQEVRIIAVHPSTPVNSIKELIALAKAKPGALNYASGGIGGAAHIDFELFKTMAGVDIVHVPYKGGASAVTALISGETQVGTADAGLLAPHIKSGKLRALAVTSTEPSMLAPGLSTVAASGLPGFESIGFLGMFAPAKTPGAIINRLNREIVRVLNRPDVKERLFNGGEEVIAGTPEQLAAVMKADIARKGKVINDLGIKIN